jgi:hypothetical protein
MYEIVNPNVESFNDAYAYLGAPRWWFEQIGFWGPPGTPPPDEEKPIPIKPMTIPTMSSPEAYKEAYPNGYDEPYPWSPPLMKSAFGGGYLGNSASSEVYVSVIIAFFIGTTIGGSVMALCMKHAKGTSYLPIN